MGFLKPRPKLTFGWVQGCHSYLDSATQKKELPSFKALGKDGLCRLLFYETRLLYQLLTDNLVK
ncbi:hypothetical protein GQR42_21655 [Microcystis aeruginosa FD4]|uniref:Uncharacterized protein n=1 Tax=Microcystis aeruginosa FD4 TaxID=2686288 RepID=A0A857D935_MICAE|nr:hypothetical protein GQR42_21655 [Microcystis aeruginosa FD4]